ncbi:MAG: molybdenum cofactor guanylyltransferase [Saprospiraceae bacterium]|nr:molybdenum cofactor guanylyltransferase [Saprospiraceae bacterium]
MKNLNGVILCGGKSSRLGFDKLSLRKEGIPIHLWWKNLLTNLCDSFYFLTNHDLQKKYDLQPFLLDSIINLGPLGGIESMINVDRSKAILVVAVDLVYVKNKDLEYLIQNRNTEKMATVFMDSSHQLYPLCAIIEPGLFEVILNNYKTETRSLKAILLNSDIQVLQRNVDLRGINTPEDYSEYIN